LEPLTGLEPVTC